MKISIYLFLTFVISITACSTRQWYEVGQDLSCQEYRKDEDPYYKNECPETSYKKYQEKRKAALDDTSEQEHQKATD